MGVGELAEVGTYGGQRFGVQGLFQFPLCVCVCETESLTDLKLIDLAGLTGSESRDHLVSVYQISGSESGL